VNLFDQFRVYREDAKDFREQRTGVLTQMIFEGREFLKEQIEFLFCHCLDDELPIVGKEEKRAAPPGTFSRLEHHVSVEFGTERLVEVGELRAEVLLEHLFEEVKAVVGNFYFLLHPKYIFLFFFISLVRVLSDKFIILLNIF